MSGRQCPTPGANLKRLPPLYRAKMEKTRFAAPCVAQPQQPQTDPERVKLQPIVNHTRAQKSQGLPPDGKKMAKENTLPPIKLPRIDGRDIPEVYGIPRQKPMINAIPRPPSEARPRVMRPGKHLLTNKFVSNWSSSEGTRAPTPVPSAPEMTVAAREPLRARLTASQLMKSGNRAEPNTVFSNVSFDLPSPVTMEVDKGPMERLYLSPSCLHSANHGKRELSSPSSHGATPNKRRH